MAGTSLSVIVGQVELFPRRAGSRQTLSHPDARTLRSVAKTFCRLCMDMPLGLHVAPLLPEFLRRNSEVSLELSCRDWFTDLVVEGYEAGVRIGVLENSDLMARRLTTG